MQFFNICVVCVCAMFVECIERVAFPTDFLLKRVMQSCAYLLSTFTHKHTEKERTVQFQFYDFKRGSIY